MITSSVNKKPGRTVILLHFNSELVHLNVTENIFQNFNLATEFKTATLNWDSWMCVLFIICETSLSI